MFFATQTSQSVDFSQGFHQLSHASLGRPAVSHHAGYTPSPSFSNYSSQSPGLPANHLGGNSAQPFNPLMRVQKPYTFQESHNLHQPPANFYRNSQFESPTPAFIYSNPSNDSAKKPFFGQGLPAESFTKPLAAGSRNVSGLVRPLLSNQSSRPLLPSNSTDIHPRYSHSRLIDEARKAEPVVSPNSIGVSSKDVALNSSPFGDNRNALLKYVVGTPTMTAAQTPRDGSLVSQNQANTLFITPQEERSHHGKSVRSIQLFEHEESQSYPHVTHNRQNPLVKAVSLENIEVEFAPKELDIHQDSCYNFLNKKRYQKGHHRTPLEDFFLKESIAQFKVAQYLAQNHLLSPYDLKKPHIVRNKKYMLVLDIDETLVHSELIMEQSVKKIEFEGKNHDRYIEFPNLNGTSDVYGVRFRPYLMEFINRMSKIYDLAVYTASAQDYADAVMDQLDPQKNIFAARLYREHCVPVNNMNIKNMLNFDGRDVFLVDNLIYSYSFHLHQGIPICPFVDDPMDVELRDLATILEQVERFDSLESLIQNLLGLNDFYQSLELASQEAAAEISPSTLLEKHASKNQQNTRTAGGNTISILRT